MSQTRRARSARGAARLLARTAHARTRRGGQPCSQPGASLRTSAASVRHAAGAPMPTCCRTSVGRSNARWSFVVQCSAARTGQSAASEGCDRAAAARAAGDARGAARRTCRGPAVRVLEMGRALSRTARVAIAAPCPVEIADDRLAIVPYDPCGSGGLRAQPRLCRRSRRAGLRAPQLSVPDTAGRTDGRRPLLPVHPPVPRTVTLRTAGRVDR